MPRLIPRLLKFLEKSKEASVPEGALQVTRRQRPNKSVSPPASSTASQLLASQGRTRSVLLEEVNPIRHVESFKRHKAIAPKVRVLPSRQIQRDVSEQEARSRRIRMTAEEREWWANPYREYFVH